MPTLTPEQLQYIDDLAKRDGPAPARVVGRTRRCVDRNRRAADSPMPADACPPHLS
jgi:hypothetical protein